MRVTMWALHSPYPDKSFRGLHKCRGTEELRGALVLFNTNGEAEAALAGLDEEDRQFWIVVPLVVLVPEVRTSCAQLVERELAQELALQKLPRGYALRIKDGFYCVVDLFNTAVTPWYADAATAIEDALLVEAQREARRNGRACKLHEKARDAGHGTEIWAQAIDELLDVVKDPTAEDRLDAAIQTVRLLGMVARQRNEHGDYVSLEAGRWQRLAALLQESWLFLSHHGLVMEMKRQGYPLRS